MKDISIIIIHWNTPENLKVLMTKLHGDGSDLQTIVVDNSSDKSLDWIKVKFPKVYLIENKINRGFAFACNQGLMAAKGKWVFFLNPDVEISKKEIEAMKSYAETQHLDAVCPQTAESYEKPLPSALSLLTEFTPLKYLLSTSFFRTKTLFGGALMIRRETLLELGGWDERFFLWFEDCDLTKMLIDRGCRIGRVDILINHQGGTSFKLLSDKQKKELFFLSMEIFALKHFSRLGQFIVKLIKSRYAKNYLSPTLTKGTTITVPNLKKDLLDSFLKRNYKFISDLSVVETLIVSSSINNSEIWEYRKKFPGIRFIPIEKNKGFANSVNIGFRISRSTWVATVNDDVALNGDWLDKCLKHQRADTGSINPLIYNVSGKIESAGVNILPYGKAEPQTAVRSNNIFETDITNAACVLYSHDALNKVGLYDEKFGSYLEDVDLSLRLKRNNYKNIVVPSAKIVHVGQSTSMVFKKYKAYLDFKNWILVILKNWGLKMIILNFPSIFLERLRNLWGIVKIKHENN